jgi:hypothetical protein
VEQVFVGRDAELAALSDGLAAAADGRPTLWWVEGDAGFGKTALTRRLIASAPAEFTVLSAEADELGRQRRFGVVADLGAATTADSFSVGLDLLRMIGERTENGPMLVVVEDLHWADEGSRAALLTVARRIEGDRVCLVVTSRSGGPADGWQRLVSDETRCRRLELGPLDAEQVHRWANQVGVAVTAAQAARLRAHTGGHPLYVKTLLSELTTEQLTSTSRELPAPRSLASATIGALAELPAEAGQLASALAVLGERTALPVLARVADVAEPTPALERLLATGFVRWLPGEPSTPVEFVHPLYRLAVYDDLSPTRRQRLHRAAADQLGRVAGWPHRVAAADTVDDALADELDAGASAELANGATDVAARYLSWAVPLTSRRGVAESRMLRGARLLLADGQLDVVGELRPELEACDPSPLRDLVLGSYAYETGDSEVAQRLLESAASDAVADPSVRAAASVRLSSIYVMQGEPGRQAKAAAAALSVDGADDRIARTAWGSLASAE